ncbi:hypothetical protein KC19_11G051400 [Ceratodon purpureus]|uniref:Uncharacterized protein n=1 Tax=Ceratodon purpureus TaxID=3225 RepID=A0A8T0GB58_CERPU|nr:hypothetical protein KC19_11G051400 [Ceratodon purpureus]
MKTHDQPPLHHRKIPSVRAKSAQYLIHSVQAADCVGSKVLQLQMRVLFGSVFTVHTVHSRAASGMALAAMKSGARFSA